jgi:tellurite methyltransferase
MATRSPWALEYARTPDRYIWGTAPSALARAVIGELAGRAQVLDIGTGEGRDAVFFAAAGHRVTGIDIALAGLGKARRLAASRGVRIDWVAADLAQLPLRGAFDLVFSCGAIHYVPRPARAELFATLRRLTRPGGLHACAVFTDRLVYVEKGERIDYFAPGELAAAYEGWRIVRRRQRLIACRQDGRDHRHSVEELVARPV